MKPRNAKTLNQELTLRSDNHGVKEGSILIDGNEIHLSQHELGEDRIGSVTFSRRAFNALIDWYNRDQPPKKGESDE